MVLLPPATYLRSPSFCMVRSSRLESSTTSEVMATQRPEVTTVRRLARCPQSKSSLAVLVLAANLVGVEASMVALKRYIMISTTCCCVCVSLFCGMIVVAFLFNKRFAAAESDPWEEWEEKFGENSSQYGYPSTTPGAGGRRLDWFSWVGETSLPGLSSDVGKAVEPGVLDEGRAKGWVSPDTVGETRDYAAFQYEGVACAAVAFAAFETNAVSQSHQNVTDGGGDDGRSEAWSTCLAKCKAHNDCESFRLMGCLEDDVCYLHGNSVAASPTVPPTLWQLISGDSPTISTPSVDDSLAAPSVIPCSERRPVPESVLGCFVKNSNLTVVA